MTYLLVLGEVRKPRFAAVIERGRVEGEELGTIYRVTICKRFRKLEQATDFFLKHIPTDRREELAAEITRTNKLRVTEKE